MKNFLTTFLLFLFTISNSSSHTSHYQNLKKIEMEVFKDGKVIGYNHYFFEKEKDIITVKNQIKFKVKLFGIKVFRIEGYGVEKYQNNKLISYESKTLQNEKKKFVNLIYDSKKNKFDVKGSSYNGIADTNNVIGNWWNHRILETESQISPISGSIKKQIVNFISEENIKLYGKNFESKHFKILSKDQGLPEDKKLNFDVWLDKKTGLILKVKYSKMGNWEYRLKSFN